LLPDWKPSSLRLPPGSPRQAITLSLGDGGALLALGGRLPRLDLLQLLRYMDLLQADAGYL